MHIGIDASRATLARRTGTEGYSLRLIQALTALPSGDRFTLYTRDSPAPGLFPPAPNVSLRVMPFPRLWTHLRLPVELLRHPPDVLFVPAHSLPLTGPRASVVTVHDLGYLHYPQAHPPARRLYLDRSTRFSARAAARVIADSQATRADLIRYYNIPPGKIAVVYPGRDESLRPVLDPATLAGVRQKYGLPGPYLLHVGTLQPRKNLIRLLEALQLLTAQHPEITLALAGQRGWLAAPILARIRAPGLESRVRLLDYVDEADLPALYSAAQAYVFPSLYEGFGFTPLEAMACGTPVVCSRASSLPEVVGDAAWLVDPHDAPGMAAALDALLRDPARRAGLVARGMQQIGRFSWGRCAEQTLAVLHAAAA